MEANLAKAEGMMNNHANEFLAVVLRGHKAWGGGTESELLGRKSGGFACLWPDNAEYNEYKTFEERLESSVRERLVNPIIGDLFELYGIQSLWADKNSGKGPIHAYESNRGFEQKWECEFIVEDENERIAYRYTYPNSERGNMRRLRRFTKRNHVRRICIIDWAKEYTGKYSFRAPVVYTEDYSFLEDVALRDFFDRYFPKSVFDTFNRITSEAIARAIDLLGFRTVRIPTASTASRERARILKQLRSFKIQPKKYIQAPKSRQRGNTLNQLDCQSLDAAFFDHGLYRALCGSEDFARSFTTAEYLFSAFDRSVDMDFTPIVIGYIKAVEQLEKFLLGVTLETPDIPELWIKKNGKEIPRKTTGKGEKLVDRMHPFSQPKNWSQHIRFLPEYEEYFDTSLVSMANLLHENRGAWRISDRGRHFFLYKTRNYAKFDRNGYVHKDNLERWKEVVRVRANTYLIMYMLLGGYRIERSLPEQIDLLGMGPALYDDLSTELYDIPRSLRRYILEFGEESAVRAIRLYEREDALRAAAPAGDNRQRVLFVRDRSPEKKISQELIESPAPEDIIELSSSNIPSKVILKIAKGQKKVLWEQ